MRAWLSGHPQRQRAMGHGPPRLVALALSHPCPHGQAWPGPFRRAANRTLTGSVPRPAKDCTGQMASLLDLEPVVLQCQASSAPFRPQCSHPLCMEALVRGRWEETRTRCQHHPLLPDQCMWRQHVRCPLPRMACAMPGRVTAQAVPHSCAHPGPDPGTWLPAARSIHLGRIQGDCIICS